MKIIIEVIPNDNNDPLEDLVTTKLTQAEIPIAEDITFIPEYPYTSEVPEKWKTVVYKASHVHTINGRCVKNRFGPNCT